MRLMLAVAFVLSASLVPASQAQNASDDDYTRYELLDPDTASFRIIYDVSATSPGAALYFNPIRKGSVATDESVVDLMTGTPLKFDVVSGAKARESGFSRADPEGEYIRVHLARPVPTDGEGRIRIYKTYKDPKSYFRQEDQIVFDRSLGIRRNSVILPAGYELTACNVPSQVISEADGRIKISFLNTAPGAAPLVLKARKLPAGAAQVSPAAARPNAGATSAPGATPGPRAAEALRDIPVAERAFQDREIVYFLEPPETHSFRLYHDYTESRPGTDTYLNIVRAGSRVSKPSARLLDTGAALQVETLKGEAITRAGLDIGEPVQSETEVVVIRFPPVAKGHTTRVRIEETYTDPSRYGLVGDELVWNRNFGRPKNDVVLPAGWYLTTSSIPAAVTQMSDGRIRLAFVNPRPDSIDVFLKARRRAVPPA